MHFKCLLLSIVIIWLWPHSNGGEYSGRCWMCWRHRRLYWCVIWQRETRYFSMVHHGEIVDLCGITVWQQCRYALEVWRVFPASFGSVLNVSLEFHDYVAVFHSAGGVYRNRIWMSWWHTRLFVVRSNQWETRSFQLLIMPELHIYYYLFLTSVSIFVLRMESISL